jgi:hypothetical protein
MKKRPQRRRWGVYCLLAGKAKMEILDHAMRVTKDAPSGKQPQDS